MQTKVFIILFSLPILIGFSQPADGAYGGSKRRASKDAQLKKVYVNAPSSGKSGFDGYEPQGLAGLSVGSSKNVGRWIEMEALYATRKSWTNEITLEFYALTKTNVVLKGKISQVNIPEGARHYGVMYLHPTTVQRFGDVERVAVRLYEQGVLLDTEQWPEYSKKEWWTKYAANEGHLKKLSETPFILSQPGKYEDTK